MNTENQDLDLFGESDDTVDALEDTLVETPVSSLSLVDMFNSLPKQKQDALTDAGVAGNLQAVRNAYTKHNARKAAREAGSALYDKRANGPITPRLNKARPAGTYKNRRGKMVKRAAMPANRFFNLDGLGTSQGLSATKDGVGRLADWIESGEALKVLRAAHKRMV